MKIHHSQITLQNHNAENHPFTFKNITDDLNANTSLEESTITQNLDTIICSQPLDKNLNETTEPDFSSTLLDHGPLF